MNYGNRKIIMDGIRRNSGNARRVFGYAEIRKLQIQNHKSQINFKSKIQKAVKFCNFVIFNFKSNIKSKFINFFELRNRPSLFRRGGRGAAATRQSRNLRTKPKIATLLTVARNDKEVSFVIQGNLKFISNFKFQISNFAKILFGRNFLKKLATMICIVATLTVAYFQNYQNAQSASYNWGQTTWAGGATANDASHATDQTGWTQYSAKDAAVSAGTEVSLTTTAGSITQTNDGTTSTGFHLSGYAESSTELNGTSGSGASVELVGFPAITLSNDGGGAWGYRKNIPITGSSAGILTNYQVAVTINTASLVSAGKMQSDGRDMRFANSSGTELPYWIESGINTSTTVVWVKVDSLAALPTVTSIYFYYGNSAATAVASGSNTFMFFDDFNDNNITDWTAVGSGVPDAVGGQIHGYEAGSTVMAIGARKSFSTASAVWETKLTLGNINVGNNYDRAGWALMWNGSVGYFPKNSYWVYLSGQAGDNAIRLVRVDGTDQAETNIVSAAWTADTSEHDIKVTRNAANQFELFVDGVSKGTGTDSTYSSMSYTAFWGLSGGGGWVKNFYSNIMRVRQYTAAEPTVGSFGSEESTYVSSGTFTSGTIDTGQVNASWGNLSWTATGTGTIAMKARTCSASDCAGATEWASCSNISSGSALSDGGCATAGHRYAQYQAALSTADVAVTPSLDEVTLGYNYYANNQTLTSSKYDTSDAANVLSSLQWTEGTTSAAETQTALAQLSGGTNSQTAVSGTGNTASVSLDQTGVVAWATPTTVDSTGDVGQYTSLTLGTDGFARISYYDAANNYNLKFVQCTNANCSTKNIQTVDSTGYVGQYNSLALGANDFARISYYDATNQDLKFVQCTNANCSTKNIQTVDSTGVGQYTSLVLGTDGFARISYWDVTNYDLKFVQCTSADCSTKNINTIDSTDIVGAYSSLALGADGFARISYHDSTNGDLKFVQCTNADCSTKNPPVIVDASTGLVGRYTSLALGADGFARIIYSGFDVSINAWVKFSQCTNADCSAKNTTTVIQGTDNDDYVYLSLELDTNDFARVSYYDSVGGLKFIQCTNAACSLKNISTVASGYTGLYTSLSLDSDNLAHISYYDGTNSDLKFIYQAEPYYSSGTFTSGVVDTGQVNASWGNLSWTATGTGTIAMKARTCSASDCAGATEWASCSNISSGSAFSDGGCATAGHRYAQYQAALSTTDTAVTPSLDEVTLGYTFSPPSANADVKFQLQTSADGNTWTGWMGTDGTDATYFSDASGGDDFSALAIGGGGSDRWIQYKTFLTSDGEYAPVLTDVTPTYVVNAMPSVSVTSAVQNADGTLSVGYTLSDADDSAFTVSAYADLGITLNESLDSSDTTITVSAATLLPTAGTIMLDSEQISYTGKSGNDLTGCTRGANNTNNTAHTSGAIAWAKATTATGNITANGQPADQSTGTGKEIVWTINTDYDGVYRNGSQGKIRVSANDGDAANQVGNGESSTLVIDTKNPTGVSFTIDNSKDSAVTNNILNIAATEDDAVKTMSFSNNPGSFTNDFVSFANAYAYTGITGDPATVYMRVKDSHGNYTDFSVVTPAKPQSMTYYDTSSALLSEFREFVAWGAISTAQDGSGTFSAYKVYRSIDDITFSLIGTINDRTVNYYLDSGLGDEGITLGENLTANYTDPITVSDASDLPVSGTVQIGTEKIIYTNKSGNDLVGISRGMMGTTATTHSNGDDVIIFREYYYKVTAEDNLGNVSDFSATVSDTPDGQGGSDSTAPTISNVAVSNINTTSATVTWDTDELANSYVGYSTDTTYLPEKGLASMVTSHSITLTGLDSATAYNLRIKSYDALNNPGQNDKDSPGNNDVGDFTFSTLAGPEISSVTVDSNNTNATVAWVTTTDADTYVVYSDTVTNGALVEAEEVGTVDLVGGSPNFNHSQTVSAYNNAALVSGATYYFYVKSTDASDVTAIDNNGGNFFSFSTTQDDDAPEISGVSAAVRNNTQAVIAWTTNEGANSTVNYGTVSGGPYTGSGTVATYDRSHYVILSGLTPNTTYYYTVTSADINTNSETSIEYSFTTLRNPEEQHNPLSSITMLYNTGGAAGDPKVLTDTKAVIAFNTDQAALCTIESGTNAGSYAEVPVLETDYNKNHSMHLTGLIFSTKYYYRITCEDNLATVILSAEYNFTTAPIQTDHLDLTDPGDPTVVQYSDTEAVIILPAANTEATSRLCYGAVAIDEGDIGGGTGTCAAYSDVDEETKTHYYYLSGLSANTVYYVRSKITDAETSSINFTSENVTFTTQKIQTDHPNLTNPGNPATVQYSDTEAVIILPAANTASTSRLCYGTTEINDVNNCVNAQVITTPTRTHHFRLSGLTASTLYYMRTKITDSETSSINFTSDNVSFTTSAKLQTSGEWGAGQTAGDATAPEISGVGAGMLTGESATIKWSTNEKSSSYVRYGISAEYGSMAGSDLINISVEKYATDHSVIINSLIPSTKYYYTVISVDAAGNIGESGQNSFTTKAPSDLTAIKIESKTLGEAKITWSTAKDLTSIVDYGLTTGYSERKESSTKTKKHEINLTGLQIGKTYHLRVQGKDGDGNLYSSSDYTFDPKSPPQISNISIADVSENSAKITFTTSVPSDTLVVYADINDEKNSGSQGSPEMVSSHEIELKNLASGTTYGITIKVRDEQGNETENASEKFTTGKDENPPRIEQNKTDAAIAQGDKVQVIISWLTNEPADTSLLYKEGRSGPEKEVKISDSFTDSHIAVITAFKSGALYYYKMKSVDQSGNATLSGEYAILTPRKRENIIQVITNNFQEIFKWARF